MNKVETFAISEAAQKTHEVVLRGIALQRDQRLQTKDSVVKVAVTRSIPKTSVRVDLAANERFHEPGRLTQQPC